MFNESDEIKESKREKFLRLGSARTNKIIETIDLLGNLSNKSNYDYTEEDVEKIFKAIDSELKYVKQLFVKSSDKNKKFKL